jgi:hypothetical protein
MDMDGHATEEEVAEEEEMVTLSISQYQAI